MAKKKKKIKLDDASEGGMVYSTNSNFAFAGLADMLNEEHEDAGNHVLEVHLEKKHRGGKTAIIIRGFASAESELQALAKKLKSTMGVGGSVKAGEIIIQGDRREQAMALLEKWGHKTKRVGA
jgi:translation initiation factor 1